MGVGSSKDKIRELLIRASNKRNISLATTMLKGNHILQPNLLLSNAIDFENIKMYDGIGNDQTSSEGLDLALLISNNSSINNKLYPQRTIGMITSVFKGFEKKGTCFLIERNVIVTVATNVFDEQGQKPKEIHTSLSKDKINPNNILVLTESEDVKRNTASEDLAVLYTTSGILDEWLGVEIYNEENIYAKDLILVSSLGEEKETINEEENKEENQEETNVLEENNLENNTEQQPERTEVFKFVSLHQINIGSFEPKNLSEVDKDLLKLCFGAPVYYSDFGNNANVVGYFASDYRIHCINDVNMKLLIQGVNKGNEVKKKDHTLMDFNTIEKLDLSRSNFSPIDIKYFSEFNLKSLVYLDLGSNMIKPEGMYYFTQGYYPCLKVLNLNFTQICDEGIFHLANAALNVLEELYLFHK